ncbi:MAG: hypothetical protein ABEJ61_11330 [Haloferacaceae archaeon]
MTTATPSVTVRRLDREPIRGRWISHHGPRPRSTTRVAVRLPAEPPFDGRGFLVGAVPNRPLVVALRRRDPVFVGGAVCRPFAANSSFRPRQNLVLAKVVSMMDSKIEFERWRGFISIIHGFRISGRFALKYSFALKGEI